MTRLQRVAVSALGIAGLVAILGILVPFSPEACRGWPLCNGQVLPPSGGEALVAWIHRALAALLVALLAWLVGEARGRGPAFSLSCAALGAVLVEVAVGAGLALGKTGPVWRALHLGLGVGSVGSLAALAVAAFAEQGPSRAVLPAAVVGFVGLLHLGLVMAGRWVEATVLGFGIGLLMGMWGRERSEFVSAGSGIVGLALLQLLGWWLTKASPGSMAMMAAGSVGITGGVGALAAIAWFGPPRVHERPAVPMGTRLVGYWQLTKPRVVLLLLITTVCAMLVAGGLHVPLWLLAATVVGGALSAGGANALNCVVDRDVDALMRRTRTRPLVVGRLLPASALVYGLGLGLVAFGLLASLVNLLAATLAALGYLFYVLVYSVWLKRWTDQNIVIGGAAGAIPPLVGWAAATDRLDPLALLMFLVIFLWTPPHFWALALVRREDYARARIPMLPVVRGEERTRREILAYCGLLVACTLAVASVGRTGPLYLVSAVVLGSVLLRAAWRLYWEGTVAAAWSLFKLSNAYLAFLFGAMVVDRLVRGGV